MADSYTPNLNLTKPEVGHADDVWGGVIGLNGDLDILDAVFLATGLSTVAAPAGQPFAGVPGVGLRIGKGKVLNIEGQAQYKDPTDITKVGVFSSDLIPTATTVDLKFPPVGGTIATKEILVATVQAGHPAGTILSGYYGNTPPSGYVFVDGRTIGDATSLATNRANDDCQRLFLHLWGLGMAVAGGRGANAAADWAAHKQLVLPDHSGRVMAGRDNLSGTAQGVLSGYTAIGVAGGAQTHTLTEAQVPPLSVTLAMDATGSGPNGNKPQAGGNGNVIGGTGSVANGGGGAAHPNVQPTIAVDVVMAL